MFAVYRLALSVCAPFLSFDNTLPVSNVDMSGIATMPGLVMANESAGSILYVTPRSASAICEA